MCSIRNDLTKATEASTYPEMLQNIVCVLPTSSFNRSSPEIWLDIEFIFPNLSWSSFPHHGGGLAVGTIPFLFFNVYAVHDHVDGVYVCYGMHGKLDLLAVIRGRDSLLCLFCTYTLPSTL